MADLKVRLKQNQFNSLNNEFPEQPRLEAIFRNNWPNELDAWYRNLLLQKPKISPPPVKSAIWNAWIESVSTHGMSSLVYMWLKETNQNQQPPTEIMADLRQMYVANIALAERRYRQVVDVLSKFEEADIQPIVLKGAALAHMLYDLPEQRPSSDIDILISPEQHAAARSKIIECGFVTCIGDTTPYLHAEPFKSKKYKFTVDLHTAISPYAQVIDTIDSRCLFEQSQNSQGIRVLNTKASLILASLHLIYNHRQDSLLIWLYDIHLLANEFQDEYSWQKIVEKSVDWQARIALSRALQLAQVFFGTQFPQLVDDLTQFPPLPAEYKLNQYAILYQSQATPKYLWLKTHLFQLSGLSNNRARWHYLKNRITPDRQEINYFYPQLESWPTLFAHVARWFLILFAKTR